MNAHQVTMRDMFQSLKRAYRRNLKRYAKSNLPIVCDKYDLLKNGFG